jgi:ATP synthase protein I
MAPGGMAEYDLLQRQLLLATLALAVVAVPLSAFLFGRATAISLLLGSLAGLLYLKLLARTVARIGPESRQVGKSQLLVPVVLVLAASRVPGLEIVPALVGFLLYKPAILLQVFLPSRLQPFPG